VWNVSALLGSAKRRNGILNNTLYTMLLTLATAQRIGEVSGISLSESELNGPAPVWKIPGTRTKNGEPHRVPLSGLALRLIAEARILAGDSMWLISNPSRIGPSILTLP
jgi:integrase